MSTIYTLTLHITGESLQDLDNQLTNCAGDRLKARILARAEGKPQQDAPPPGLNIVGAPEPEKNVLGEELPVEKPKKVTKVLQPTGSRKQARERNKLEPLPEVPKEIEVTPETAAKPVAEIVQEKQTAPMTKDDAIAALSKVNEKFGIDRAKSCLEHFEIARLGQLDTHKYADFVNYCQALV